MDDIAVFEAEPGVYIVSGGGQYQPFDPDLPGFTPMTRERAEEVASLIRAGVPQPPSLV